MALDTARYKKELETELKKLEGELQSVGRKNPNNPDDWEPVQGETNIDPADRNELADTIEQYEENSAILKELETRYNNVKRALTKIDEGVFGVCEISGEQIEVDRLDANPAARTCKAHMNDKVPGV